MKIEAAGLAGGRGRSLRGCKGIRECADVRPTGGSKEPYMYICLFIQHEFLLWVKSCYSVGLLTVITLICSIWLWFCNLQRFINAYILERNVPLLNFYIATNSRTILCETVTQHKWPGRSNRLLGSILLSVTNSRDEHVREEIKRLNDVI